MPRTILGILVGVALGVAGALTQAHTRNPLADPGLLGVTSGAAFAVVAAIHLLGVTSPSGTVVFALVGALGAGCVVVVLSQRITVLVPGMTLVLTGAIVTALLASVTSGMLLLERTTMDVFRFWSVGSLVGRGPEVIWTVLPFIAAGLVLAATHAATRLGLGGPAWRIPVAGTCGAILVLGADVIGRVTPVTSEVQVGIVIALIGAPLFIVLARGYLGERS